MRLATEIKSNIRESIVDGEGYRIVMFTQGCPHHCRGCHNSTTWKIDGGIEYSVHEISEHILNMYEKGKGFFRGVTISGGDPLIQKEELIELLSILKKNEPDLNIWIYTGFDTEEVEKDFSELFEYVDVFVTGKYVEELKSSKFIDELEPKDYLFRGSINQELYEPKKM